MAYPTMMVHVDFNAATKTRVRLAAGLADRFEATLIGVAACAPHPPFARGGVDLAPLFTEENLGDLKVALEQLEGRFRSIAAKGSPQVEWRSALDRTTEFVAREACAADLIIIGRERLSADPFRSLDPGALLLSVGRPVLMVPTGLDHLHANRMWSRGKIRTKRAAHSRTHCRSCMMPKRSSSWRLALSMMPMPSSIT